MKHISFCEDLKWTGERFTTGMAWIDLQFLAEEGAVRSSFRALAERWMWSTNKTIRFINELESKGLIKISRGTFHGTITEQLIVINSDSYKDNGTIAERSMEHKEESLNGPSPDPTLPFPPEPPITHTPVTTPPIIPQEDKVEKTRKRKERFVPPSVDEISVYCQSRGNDIDPQEFYDFYTTNGWVQGQRGKPIQDWRACVRTWEAKRRKNPYSTAPVQKTTFKQQRKRKPQDA